MKGNNLKALRALYGMNQSDVAKYLNMSLHTYCNKENGKGDFTMDEAKKLSDLFQKSVDEIFFGSIDFKMNTNAIS